MAVRWKSISYLAMAGLISRGLRSMDLSVRCFGWALIEIQCKLGACKRDCAVDTLVEQAAIDSGFLFSPITLSR